ncbi:ankyrin repeat and SOCS box protein 8 isoform X1 [Mobula birostris]|uniref:ankyrin repeat and SOCS box protein 8 isoform X1 n=2 Tax=Mobula birostris TaxID=1983395 RepID=UPI003B284E1A
MWAVMESIQSKYSLSERLIRAITLRGLPHDTVHGLIQRGADVNCTHGTLKPLHCACMMADPECVELLLENGAEVNAQDGYQRTPLHYAAERDAACVRLLLAQGAEAAAGDGGGHTPLHWAAFRERPACARALLEGAGKGSQGLVNARDRAGDTPLHWAACRANLACARLLLEYGAEPRALNRGGQSPVCRLQGLLRREGEEARGERSQACLELLLRAGGGPRGPGPDTLRTLSRHAVRRSLGARHLPPAVSALPLPLPLQRDLLLLG